jgi:hypothetical protein
MGPVLQNSNLRIPERRTVESNPAPQSVNSDGPNKAFIIHNRSFENVWNFNYLQTTVKKTLRGFGPLANYADRAAAASWRSSTNFCG